MSKKSPAVKDKPLISFVLLAYNQEEFIRESVKSALDQTYEPLEIILSDDCSTDKTFEIMTKLAKEYCGPHRVKMNRNCKNVGIGSHINALMELAEGEVIVAAGGDDISSPHRAQEIAHEIYQNDQKAYSVWSSATYIDADGQALDRDFPTPVQPITDTIMIRNTHPVIGATHAWSKEVFDVFGPLLPSVVFEDNAISFRSYLLGDVLFIDKKLVSYRRHGNNVTNFLSTKDHSALYERGASRLKGAIVSVRQRKIDLDRATVNGLIEKKRADKMYKELDKLNKKLSYRYEVFSTFPNISFKIIYGSIFDISIMKFILRSLAFVLAGRGSAE